MKKTVYSIFLFVFIFSFSWNGARADVKCDILTDPNGCQKILGGPSGTVKLKPGFGKQNDNLNNAVTPNFKDSGEGGSGSGLVPCGSGDVPSGDTEAAKTVAEDCNFDKLIMLAKTIINFLLFTVAMPLAAISFAWAGWLYLSSAGNESKIKEAHQIFGNVVLGLSIALAAWLIVNAVVIGLGVGAKYNPLTGGTFGDTP